jgi:hypothetical protein
MSEWLPVLAVFWLLWALDGVRFGTRRMFTVLGGGRLRGARIVYSRLSRPGISPGSWRLAVPDVPLSLSPAGLCNRPAGSAGRPVEHPTIARAWAWHEVREVGVARGWVFVNGERFCPDTRHVTARQLLELAPLAPDVIEKRIHDLLASWFRSAHLRRRARLLAGRTVVPAALNALTAATLALITLYVIADLPSRLPAVWSGRVAGALPWILLAALLAHVVAVVLAWRGVRRLKAVVPEKRASTLLGALLLPPQALRLRAIAGDGYFPPQHPLAAVLAFGRRREREEAAFQTIADLRWPVGDAADSPRARDITAWFRTALEETLLPHLDAAGIRPDSLLAAPVPDAAESCSYCPRCRDQFVAGPTECPHRVPLRPLRAAEKRG